MKTRRNLLILGLIGLTMTFIYGIIATLSVTETVSANAASLPVIADFEGGAPPDWFVYNGGGSSVDTAFVTISGTEVLSASYNVTDFGGFGALLPDQDWTTYDGIQFRFYGSNSGLTYLVEVQDGNDAVVERFQGSFVDDFTGWQTINIAFADFIRGGFQDPGAPNDGFQLNSIAAWVFPLPAGNEQLWLDDLELTGGSGLPSISFTQADVSVVEGTTAVLTITLSSAYTDTITVDYATSDGTADNTDYTPVSGTLTMTAGMTYTTFTVDTIDNGDPDGARTFSVGLSDPVNGDLGSPDNATITILDNEAPPAVFPVIANFDNGAPDDWFVYNGGGSSVNPTFVNISGTGILSTSYNVTDFGGFGANLPDQNWGAYTAIQFRFYGSNSGLTYTFEAQDGSGSVVERFHGLFVDDFTGWQTITIPFANFVRGGFQDPGAPDDGFQRNSIAAWVFPLPAGNEQFWLDDLEVTGEIEASAIQFTEGNVSVVEGETAVVTVTIAPPPTTTVTVDYATVDGSANDTHYTPASGTLTLTSAMTITTITVDTIDNSQADGNRTFSVALSNPVNAILGSPATAVVTILDDETPSADKAVIVDDFESGLPTGVDGDGITIGFATWGDDWNGTAVNITTTTATDAGIDPVPNGDAGNQILEVSSFVAGWGGFTHAFENETVDTWVNQDWSGYQGISFWYYGTGTGTTTFIDVIENRNPGSTTDDGERWSYEWTDDQAGWQLVQFPFTQLFRKDIGNGAPNDGWTGEEVHGWALGTLGTGGNTELRYIDNFALTERVTTIDDFESGLPTGVDGDGITIGFATWGDDWNGTAVNITTTTATDAGIDPIPSTAPDNQLLEVSSFVAGWGGFTHALENETVDTWVNQDWSSYVGLCFWYYGTGTGTTTFIDIIENRNPSSTTDDGERWSYEWTDDQAGWQLIQVPFTDLFRKDIGNGAPNDGWTGEEVHGWALGTLSTGGNTELRYIDGFSIYGNDGSTAPLAVAFAMGEFEVTEGETAVLTLELNYTSTEPITLSYRTDEGYARPDRDYVATSDMMVIPAGSSEASITIQTLDNDKYEVVQNVMVEILDVSNAEMGFQSYAILTINDDEMADPALLHDFEGYHSFLDHTGDFSSSITELADSSPLAVPNQGAYEQVLTLETNGTPVQLVQEFTQAEDWSGYEGLSFWYYGTGSGENITVELLENQIATTSNTTSTDWVMVWSDEFDDPAGTPPDPNVWKHEIGDGALNGIPGWGNSESQYYTDDPANASTDGNGNLAITMHKVNTATTDLQCWYGPCEYTSARLITQDRLAYEYGRIEARIQVPSGGSGLWPAFWTLGTDIREVGWPQTGEIDIMEYVSRLPNEIFGTIHGPGYSGGASFGNEYDFGFPVHQDFHTYTIEWTPDEIRWYVDDIYYHQAIPDDVDPNEWVFNHPFFMLLNMAIGGNFGGSIDPSIPFPQTMLVDYVRVYQADNTSERFEASFVDSQTGWQKVTIPFADFTRSSEQPVGAPDDGLTLTNVWGYGLHIPDNVDGTMHLDRFYLETTIPEIGDYMLFLPFVTREP